MVEVKLSAISLASDFGTRWCTFVTAESVAGGNMNPGSGDASAFPGLVRAPPRRRDGAAADTSRTRVSVRNVYISAPSADNMPLWVQGSVYCHLGR